MMFFQIKNQQCQNLMIYLMTFTVVSNMSTSAEVTTNDRVLLSSLIVGTTLIGSLYEWIELSAYDLALLTTVVLVVNLPRQQQSQASSTTQQVCDSGWEAYDGHCYARFTNTLSFADASTYCQGQGGYLVGINSANENTWITQNVLKGISCADPYSCATWTGGNDILVENSFVWETTNTPFTYTNWEGINPNDSRDQRRLDCVEIFYTGQWNDLPCDKLKPFICEKNQN